MRGRTFYSQERWVANSGAANYLLTPTSRINSLIFPGRCALAKLNRTRATGLDALEDGVTTVFPAKSSTQRRKSPSRSSETDMCSIPHRGRLLTISPAFYLKAKRFHAASLMLRLPQLVDCCRPICMSSYLEVLGEKQSVCCGNLMIKYFWKRANRIWSMSMPGPGQGDEGLVRKNYSQMKRIF